MLIKGHKLSHCMAAVLFGVGMAMGVVPIIMASLLMRENLFLVCLDKMDIYWRDLKQHDIVEK